MYNFAHTEEYICEMNTKQSYLLLLLCEGQNYIEKERHREISFIC